MPCLRLTCAALAVLIGLLASGCLTPDQIAALQKDVSEIKGQMEALRRDQGQTSTKVEAIRTAVSASKDGGREQVAETNRQIEAIRDDLRVINSRLEEIQHRLVGLPSTLQGAVPRSSPSSVLTGSSPSGNAQAEALPPAAGGRSDDVFNAAYADYSKGNYAPAILGFQDYNQRNPSSEKADDALYWIGLCHYDQGEYAEAIAQFDKLIQQYPNADKVTSAHLKKGMSLLEMNRTAQGVVQLQFVLERFPRTEEARIARDRLGEIGVKP